MAAKAATLTTRARKTRPKWVRVTKNVIAVLFLFFLIGVTYFGFIFVGEMRHASELMVSLPDKLRQYSMQPSRIYSADGKLLYSIQSEFREPIKYSEIPKQVRDAIVAAEDKRFYDHSGVDYWAMGRIVVVGAKEGRLSQGGSTLTMQLAKRFYSEGQKTFKRKLQDVALAITMEREMTKEQILTLYLNTMYFGEKAYGIQAAADVYFNKKLDKLTLGEAAMLARCVRRPSDENPIENLDKATENRNVVLAVMRDEKMITPAEFETAIGEKVKLSKPKDRITSQLNQAPYFVSHVLQYLKDEMPDLDLKSGGYTIYTTLDTRIENFAERQVAAFVKEHRNERANAAAFVMMDKEGKILAEVGGVDFDKDQFNIVTQGKLQPGSSFKPFVYATAMSAGALSMDDTLSNVPFKYDMGPGVKPWEPRNSRRDEDYITSASVTRAIAGSYNVAAAHVMERVGPQQVASFAKGVFGFRSKLTAYPSMALGAVEVHPLEMAQGYGVFMLHGDRATPYCVTKVVGPDGSVVRAFSPTIIRNQLEPTVAANIDITLRAVVTSGTGHEVDAMVENARGKTGTTSDHKDIWFCGYSDGLVGVAWAGNKTVRNGRVYQLEMGHGMWGATAASELWGGIMRKARNLGLASKVAEPERMNPDEEVVKPPRDNPEDRITVIPPSGTTPPDGTTGGDGSPVVPNPATTGATGGTVGTTAGTAGGTTGGTTPPTTDPGAKPPDPEPPVRRDPPRRDPPAEETSTTQVEICAESGMRATIYCPETVTRTFRKGREPRKRCTIHGG